MFDEQPVGDQHGKCALEIARLRGLCLWALYHHQGASSKVGLPIRKALGIGPHDNLTNKQLAEMNATLTML